MYSLEIFFLFRLQIYRSHSMPDSSCLLEYAPACHIGSVSAIFIFLNLLFLLRLTPDIFAEFEVILRLFCFLPPYVFHPLQYSFSLILSAVVRTFSEVGPCFELCSVWEVYWSQDTEIQLPFKIRPRPCIYMWSGP
jgi:hypothetical protein